MNLAPLQPWVRHVVLPGAAITAVIAASGRVIQGPLGGWPQEDALNRWCVAHRTSALDRATWVPSTYADTPCTIAMSLVFGAWLRRETSSWHEAAAPLAAISVETVCFVAAAHVVGRDRPDVPWLDRPAPTPSYPSGHTGATTAMHLTVAHALARRDVPGSRAIGRAVRWGLPISVAASRVYRGMHHPSDVVVGSLLGAWTAGAVRRALGIPRR
ncbi:phosphatase PAP2 family protein [Arsenicicoccus dermatophilus]|uniref:phosphatase PAP2 family protein n=1 Tax=Arsenicicoccus dermatophilus TaxID=1076331 RepID=UPI001F4C9B5B|nr:phosphatase PAP2 family protein [Arsenicicoccus dermatophilus]